MTELTVLLYGTKVGVLHGENRTFDFHPTAEAIERFGPGSTQLSLALPLSVQQPRHLAKRRRNWFRELLPEGDFRTYLSNQAGLIQADTLGLLARYGRDVAGAVEILTEDQSPTETPALSPIDESTIRKYLTNPLLAPLGNRPPGGKTSLAGVQPKVLLTRKKGRWHTAAGGAPSSHIVKPELPAPRHSAIYDEEYGLRLARRIGLLRYETSLHTFDSLGALVIERYDREELTRVHQEDFSQILGASGVEKYQEYGGRVSLARVAEAVIRHLPPHELAHLATLVSFSVAIGNLDLHTKNISVLHPQDLPARLAPAYDCQPHAHRDDTDGRMALSVGGEYRWKAITRQHLEAEFRSWGLRSPGTLIDEVADGLQAAVSEEAPDNRADPRILPMVHSGIEKLRGHDA